MTVEAGYTGTLLYGPDFDTLAVLNNVRDVRFDMVCDAEDLTPNDASGWKASTHGLRDMVISWSMVWDGADAGLQAIRDAYLQDTPIVLWAMDGMAAVCTVLDFVRDERISNAIVVRVTAKPTLSDLEPSWLVDVPDIDVGGFVVDEITGQNIKAAA